MGRIVAATGLPHRPGSVATALGAACGTSADDVHLGGGRWTYWRSTGRRPWARAEPSRPRLDPGHPRRSRATARRRSAATPARRPPDPPRHGRAGGSGRRCRVRGRADGGGGHHRAQLRGAAAPGARRHRGHQGARLPALSRPALLRRRRVRGGRRGRSRGPGPAGPGRGESSGCARPSRSGRESAYAEFADEPWAYPESQHLAELRVTAEELLVDAELACGHTAQVLPTIEALCRSHPLREAFRVQLMTAYYRAGRQADALAVFRGFRAGARRGARHRPVARSRRARAADPRSGSPAARRAECGRAAARLPTRRAARQRAGRHRARRPRARRGPRARGEDGAAPSSPTTRRSSGASRPPRTGSRRCGTRPPCPSTTGGASPAPPTW